VLPVKLKTLELLSLASAAAPRLRASPTALARLLRRKTGRSSLGRYWDGVQYLLAEGAKDIREPVLWLTTGGEVLGRNEFGEVRYLAPDQVALLAKAFADESPDELGHGIYDEAEMDRAGVYPRCWGRLARTYDPLGTLRELFCYTRTFFEACLEDHKGVVLFHAEEPQEFDEDEDEEIVARPQPHDPEPAMIATDSVLTGDQGRRYTRANAESVAPGTLLRQVDAGLNELGYGHVGDFAMSPILAGGVVRSYLSSDRTSAAFVLLSAERGVASTHFSSRLPGDALVQVSDAFLLEIKKAKFFGSTISGGTPPKLHAAFHERRRVFEDKFGPAVPLAGTVEAAAELFELWWSKITARRK
jgi:hypothetical protein